MLGAPGSGGKNSWMVDVLAGIVLGDGWDTWWWDIVALWIHMMEGDEC